MTGKETTNRDNVRQNHFFETKPFPNGDHRAEHRRFRFLREARSRRLHRPPNHAALSFRPRTIFANREDQACRDNVGPPRPRNRSTHISLRTSRWAHRLVPPDVHWPIAARLSRYGEIRYRSPSPFRTLPVDNGDVESGHGYYVFLRSLRVQDRSVRRGHPLHRADIDRETCAFLHRGSVRQMHRDGLDEHPRTTVSGAETVAVRLGSSPVQYSRRGHLDGLTVNVPSADGVSPEVGTSRLARPLENRPARSRCLCRYL